MRFFLAASMPFLIAEGTSFAFPTPKPTTPWPSPTTTRALKLRFLPPLTTLVTRLMLTTVSFRSSCDASIFSRVSSIACQSALIGDSATPLEAMGLELEASLARRFGDGANPAVIQESATVEHDPLDPFGDQPLGDRLAQQLGARLVAGPRGTAELRLERGVGARRRTRRSR